MAAYPRQCAYCIGADYSDLELYGLEPEMGHKECGGVKGQIDAAGHMTHVMEQLEVDWKFSSGVQTADNELLARIIVKEVFRMNGLEVSFQAKPIPGVAAAVSIHM